MQSPDSAPELGAEIAVLDLVARGMKYRQIAQRLDMSERSVRRRVLDACAKLRVDTPVEAVVSAIRLELI